ncbi:ABC transporter permease [Tropicimonas isoalkanivorans]|uniref:NitT/TauT family transport system permease protein n=1 Tax=Tropicimonas isoalkanivorans TaxID=441112 RepID=A0A1I1KQ37_9RHOB|nr:ABC transporter permease [Tropicimonas isoalkanivorans]SFC62966.1 NitT/TauT family transport system permease protein [Tropicimonas isoalkanivorans]
MTDMSAIDASMPKDPELKLTTPSRRRERAMSFGILLSILLIWTGLTNFGSIPAYVIPPPQSVFQWLIEGFRVPLSDASSLWYHTGVTMWEAFLGFVVGSALGIAMGFALAHWPVAERVLYPYVVAFQALPKVAIAPLLVVWFGFGLDAKVLIVVVMTFFPLLVNSIAGYHAVEEERIELARVCNASELQIFRHIILPSSMPFIFAGLHMAAVISLLAAIVGEFVGAKAGLGLLLLQYNNSMQMGGVFAVLLILGVLGFLLNYAMQKLEAWFSY